METAGSFRSLWTRVRAITRPAATFSPLTRQCGSREYQDRAAAPLQAGNGLRAARRNVDRTSHTHAAFHTTPPRLIPGDVCIGEAAAVPHPLRRADTAVGGHGARGDTRERQGACGDLGWALVCFGGGAVADGVVGSMRFLLRGSRRAGRRRTMMSWGRSCGRRWRTLSKSNSENQSGPEAGL